MKCPYLEADKNNICNASLTHMTPSVYEVKLYCTSEEYYRCPTLLAYTLKADCDDMQPIQ